MVLNAEQADLLVVPDDELANIHAEYEELEENQVIILFLVRTEVVWF